MVNKSFGKANREKDIDVTQNTRYDPTLFFEDKKICFFPLKMIYSSLALHVDVIFLFVDDRYNLRP